MRFVLVALALLAAAPALAQPAPVPPVKETALLLTNEEIDKVWGALNAQPGTFAVMEKIKRQWEAQQPKSAEPKKD